MTPEAVALFAFGLLQPFLQEVLTRGHWTGRTMHVITVGFSFALALVAVWVTGGLAGGHVPAFTLLDPSPLLGFLVAKLTPVYALSQIVFGFVGAPAIEKVAGTAAPAPSPAPAP